MDPAAAMLADDAHARIDFATAVQQFGGIVGLGVLSAVPVAVLALTLTLTKGEPWSARRRRVVMTAAFVLSAVPALIAVAGIVLRCRGAKVPAEDWMALPVLVPAVTQVAAAVVLVGTARGFRFSAVVLALLSLPLTLRVGFASLVLIGGDGP